MCYHFGIAEQKGKLSFARMTRMDINVDFLVSGCNTHCKHCYVNGGPGPLMRTNDALACIEKLDQIAAFFPDGASFTFTLDHEPMNHPDIGKILDASSRTKHIICYHHGMTTGLGLMARGDREAVIQAYLENGYHEFGVTLHGVSAHHDEIVSRKGAFDQSIAAACFLSQMGCWVQISLMVNRFFAEDADRISRLIDEMDVDDVYFEIPIFSPHANMMGFEPYRATLETFEAIRRDLPGWRQDAEKIMESAAQNAVGRAEEKLRSMDLHRLWEKKQDALYLSLHQDCALYVGNSGAETRLLGDLRKLEPEIAAETIKKLPGNADYGAFYDMETVPDNERVLAAIKTIPRNLVYGNFASILYRAFVELGIPSILLSRQPSC